MKAQVTTMAAIVAAATPAAAAPAAGQSRGLVHASAAGGGAVDGDSLRPSLSRDGRHVAFDSAATTLAADANGRVRDVFVYDGLLRSTRLVSSGLGGQGGDGPSRNASISGDGRRVAFESVASNLVAGDTNGVSDVFVALEDGSIRRVSVGITGRQATAPSRDPDISRDGRFVAFSSAASDLAGSDGNDEEDVFVHDLVTSQTVLVSGLDGESLPGSSSAPALSPDGGHVSFHSSARLVAADRTPHADVYLADLRRMRALRPRALRLVSRASGGELQNRAVRSPFPQFSDVSAGGRHVVFDSDATNLVRGDRNADTDVFVREVRRRRTMRVSVTSRGREAGNDSVHPAISGDGRHVVFQSFAARLVKRDPAGSDIFVHDRRRRRTSIVTAGRGEELFAQFLQRPAISERGGHVAFTTTARGMTASDGNMLADVFVWRRR